jgi:hypothetical protein
VNLREPAREIRVLTRLQVDALPRETINPTHRAVIHLGLSAGLRAFVMTSANVFTIESFSNGIFRTTVSGSPLSDAQRALLTDTMRKWENPPSAAGATDQERYCP